MQVSELEAVALLGALLTCPGCGCLSMRAHCPCCSRRLCSSCHPDGACGMSPIQPASLALPSVVQTFASLQRCLEPRAHISAVHLCNTSPILAETGIASNGVGPPLAHGLDQLPLAPETLPSAPPSPADPSACDGEGSSIASWGLEVRSRVLMIQSH